jgi:hypothetical protein
MKTLNKKNLKEINKLIISYSVNEMLYEQDSDFNANTKEGAFARSRLYKSYLIAIELYERFGIAVISEKSLIEEYIPEKEEFKARAFRAMDKASEIKKAAA